VSLAKTRILGRDALVLYNDDGSPRFDWSDYNQCVTAVDFDGTGNPYIVLGRENAVEVYSPEGKSVWTKKLFPPYHEEGVLEYRLDGSIRTRRGITMIPTSLLAADYDGDGKEELIVGGWHHVEVLDGDGKTLFQHHEYQGPHDALGFADVDGDGKSEIYTFSMTALTVFTKDGPKKIGLGGIRAWPGTRFMTDNSDGTLRACIFSPAPHQYPVCYRVSTEPKDEWYYMGRNAWPRASEIIDIDGDGKSEIVYGANDGFLFVIGLDGNFKFSAPVGAMVTSMARVRLSTGDGLAVGLYSGKLLLLGRNLEILGSAEVSKEAVREIAVLNDDGSPKIVASDIDGNAVSIRL